MSTKQFISAEMHLAKLGVTGEQALNFIVTNVDQPDVIFLAARQAGVTNAMLSEITSIPTPVIDNYFAAANIDNKDLDQTSRVVNSDLGPFEAMVQFNNNIGILSNDSLRNEVQQILKDSSSYEPTFFPNAYPFYPDDGILDAEELGVGHLEAIPATSESIESLFYGGLLNMFRALDESELNLINTFPDEGNPEDFQTLLMGALGESPSPVIWTDEELAELVTGEAVEVIGKFWTDSKVGVLDHSYLGLATVELI